MRASLTLPHSVTILCSGLCAVPVLLILIAWALGDAPYFSYFLQQGLLADYSLNSLIIASGTMICSLVLGVSTAWWVTMTEFPARRFMQWLLIVPLAVPSYIAAMVYGRLLEGSGVVQYALRDMLQLEYGAYYFPQIRSVHGVVFILTITLYPYIYMLARAAFLMQSRQMLETVQLLGYSRMQQFTHLALPMARPALVAGAALVGMEALADFGVVSLYGVPALTTGIYRAWQGMYDPFTAARMASLLLIVVCVCIWLEKRSRRQARYHNVTALYHPLERWKLSALAAWGVTGICATIVLLGALLPLLVLLYWSLPNLHVFADAATLGALTSSTVIAVITGGVTILLALLFAYKMRSEPSLWVRAMVQLATLGYAVPGSVIAVGVLMLCIAIQNNMLGHAPLLTGSIMAVVWGCSIRFLTIAFQNISTGLERVTSAMDEAAIMLGASRLTLMKIVHIPMIRTSLITAFLLVFIDTMKELPATLLLRPFDVSTLAIRVYELAKDDMLPHAAPVGLVLVCISIVPVLYLNAKLTAARPGSAV